MGQPRGVTRGFRRRSFRVRGPAAARCSSGAKVFVRRCRASRRRMAPLGGAACRVLPWLPRPLSTTAPGLPILLNAPATAPIRSAWINLRPGFGTNWFQGYRNFTPFLKEVPNSPAPRSLGLGQRNDRTAEVSSSFASGAGLPGARRGLVGSRRASLTRRFESDPYCALAGSLRNDRVLPTRGPLPDALRTARSPPRPAPPHRSESTYR